MPRAVLSSGSPGWVVEFLQYLIDFTYAVHGNYASPPVVEPLLESYNPATGVACYFTEHGCQIRQLPNYSLAGVSSNYDDLPSDEKCSKKFPQVSVGGYSYIFLRFCPIHEHCYGFHVINGSEGRKDPFSSLLKCLPNPPREIFYDFACSLQEYCLNREPVYFEEVQFWHDLFHGLSHKCSKRFKYSRLRSLDVVNSEICEQFNSFLQCIKFTATHLPHLPHLPHLSQSHYFFFFCSFFYQHME